MAWHGTRALGSHKRQLEVAQALAHRAVQHALRLCSRAAGTVAWAGRHSSQHVGRTQAVPLANSSSGGSSCRLAAVQRQQRQQQRPWAAAAAAAAASASASAASLSPWFPSMREANKVHLHPERREPPSLPRRCLDHCPCWFGARPEHVWGWNICSKPSEYPLFSHPRGDPFSSPQRAHPAPFHRLPHSCLVNHRTLVW